MSKYELALFVTIRNSLRGTYRKATEEDLDILTVETMYKMLDMVDYKQAKRRYKEAKAFLLLQLLKERGKK